MAGEERLRERVIGGWVASMLEEQPHEFRAATVAGFPHAHRREVHPVAEEQFGDLGVTSPHRALQGVSVREGVGAVLQEQFDEAVESLVDGDRSEETTS